jgi:transcriptional regulator with XRE-family HTH domain
MDISCADVSVYFPSRLHKKIYGERIIPLNEIAEKSGVSTRTIRRWLHGACEPKIASLRAVCREYGWDYDELVGGTDEPRLFM